LYDALLTNAQSAKEEQKCENAEDPRNLAFRVSL
jgi:hypothetical protein